MSKIANTYAEALYTLVSDEGLEKTVLYELSVLRQCFAADPEFIRLLANPSFPKDVRCHTLDDSFQGKIQPYLLNFMKILTKKGYIHHFDRCCQAYRNSYNQAHDILPVTATTALPLSADQQLRLTAKLASMTGKNVELTNWVDITVLGGVRLDYGGKQMDDTIRHRMDTVRNLLQNTVL